MHVRGASMAPPLAPSCGMWDVPYNKSCSGESHSVGYHPALARATLQAITQQGVVTI